MIDSRDPAFERLFEERYTLAQRESAKLEGPSLAQRLVELPREEIGWILDELSPVDRATLLYAWGFWARPKQRVPERAHRIMLWLAGRRFGKNMAAAQRFRERIYAGAQSLIIIGATWREVLRYQVGGQLGSAGSALMNVFPPAERARIELKEQKGEIVFHEFGATVYLVSDEMPELRGGGYDSAWLDEIIKWRHLGKLWDNLEFSMSVRGRVPAEILITTTPRPMRFLKEIIADPDTITVDGETDENRDNLEPGYLDRLERKFGKSRKAQQERGGKILSQNEDALFSSDLFEDTRVSEAPELVRVVVAIDPAIATNPENDETGVGAIGIDASDHLYILEDATGRHSPEQWADEAIRLFDKWEADAYVGERNRGGDLVAAVLRARIRERRKSKAATARIVEVHATRNKMIRAEPVSVLQEQKRLHVVGVMPELEGEMCEYSPKLPGPSPNRLDWVVWGAFELAKLGDDKPEKSKTTIADVDAAAAVLKARDLQTKTGRLRDVQPITSWDRGRRL